VLPLAQPGHEDGEDSAHGELGPQLQTVLTWKARVLAVHDLRVGETVGYGATFTAAQAMRVALLPVGYADGLRRELSNPGTRSSEAAGGWVTAHGPGGVPQPCAIVGRVSMNLLVVDVSAALWLAASDVVTLLGEGNTAADHARIAGTIPYEILCALRSNPHIVVNES
jgi:alanine racemase